MKQGATLLAELDPTFSSADMQADLEQVQSYTAQIDRLKAQLAGKPYLPAVDRQPDRVAA